jgi:predicted metal-dependent HD superfamily phosphohydrolase
MDFIGARDHILERLRNELDKKLCYHNLLHTLDVHHAVVRLADLEKLTQPACILLETAALYHDSGMMIKYADHENQSVAFANEALPRFGYNKEEIEEIGNLIQVTCLPQKAITLNEKILCDADLDCLGRNDFFVQSFRLKLEWENFNIRTASLLEWFEFEMQFLEQHSYYTSSAIALRNKQKMENLNEIKNLIQKA